MTSREELLQSIKEKAARIRIKHKIEVEDNSNSHKSEEAFGFANVAAGDLIHSTDGTGLWNNLGVYDDSELKRIDQELATWL